MNLIRRVLESRRWKNTKTGQTASLYGAVPWYSEYGAKDWYIETVGFTWEDHKGRIGLGRTPVKTKADAIEIMNDINFKHQQRVNIGQLQ